MTAVLVARCSNHREDVDRPCAGEVRFRWGQVQSDPCSECGGREGIAVADWVRVERPDTVVIAPGVARVTGGDGRTYEIPVSSAMSPLQCNPAAGFHVTPHRGCTLR